MTTDEKIDKLNNLRREYLSIKASLDCIKENNVSISIKFANKSKNSYIGQYDFTEESDEFMFGNIEESFVIKLNKIKDEIDAMLK